MPRTELSSLLGKLPDDSPRPARPREVLEPAPEAAPTPVPTVSSKTKPGSRPAVARRTPAAPETEPSYLGFVRKDARLREDQLEALTAQARRLNRAKRNTGIRITENTLIRIAVDVLMVRIEKAKGDDEEQLLRSLA